MLRQIREDPAKLLDKQLFKITTIDVGKIERDLNDLLEELLAVPKACPAQCIHHHALVHRQHIVGSREVSNRLDGEEELQDLLLVQAIHIIHDNQDSPVELLQPTHYLLAQILRGMVGPHPTCK
jgi:hypothetical protein